MSLETIIRPINNDHSIKEAVLSLFLANPIIKPERFQQLIENEFKDKFQKFETVNQVEFQLQGLVGKPPTFNQQVLQNVGFKLLSFSKGETVRVLQGINEKSRNFISYHSFDYTRWNNFYEDYLQIINTISKFHSELFVTAFSLHYVDQFLWIENSKIDLNKLFNNNGNNIPKEFFYSSINNYTIVSEKTVNGFTYIDRLEITVDHNIRKLITISHNVTRPLGDIIQLNELLISQMFSEILNSCHVHNKEILFDILTPEVVDLIKLKRDKNE